MDSPVSASTPRNCFHSFEAHWADFARVFVGPAPTPMVRRVQSYTCCRSCRPKSSSPCSAPHRSDRGTSRQSNTVPPRSQFLRAAHHARRHGCIKFIVAGERVYFFRVSFVFHLKPRRTHFDPGFASALLAITQPSLLLSTTTGFPFKSGRKTRSQLA